MAANLLKSHICPRVQIKNFFTYVVFGGFCLLERGILFSIDFFFMRHRQETARQDSFLKQPKISFYWYWLFCNQSCCLPAQCAFLLTLKIKDTPCLQNKSQSVSVLLITNASLPGVGEEAQGNCQLARLLWVLCLPLEMIPFLPVLSLREEGPH